MESATHEQKINEPVAVEGDEPWKKDYVVTECTDWDDMDLPPSVLRGVFSYGFDKPSPIQTKAVRPIMDKRDIIAQAQSGTGKTGAFVTGTLSRVDVKAVETQILILAPTHELASQITKVTEGISSAMTGIQIQTHIGGRSTRESVSMLSKKPHVVIGTPGKIFDMLRRSAIDGQTIKSIVFDEADEMFSTGFSEQVYGLLQYLHKDVQVCLFSATFPPELENITSKLMRNPVKIMVKADQLTLEGISQYHVALDTDNDKYDTLKDLYGSFTLAQTIIYCNSVKRVEDLYDAMIEDGFPVCCIHGNMESHQREASFKEFISGKFRVLISSDITARGIDVQQVSTVVNFDFPENPHTYLHRIGRSGRWGRKGMGINFVTRKDYTNVKAVEEYYSTEIKELPSSAVMGVGGD